MCDESKKNIIKLRFSDGSPTDIIMNPECLERWDLKRGDIMETLRGKAIVMGYSKGLDKPVFLVDGDMGVTYWDNIDSIRHVFIKVADEISAKPNQQNACLFNSPKFSDIRIVVKDGFDDDSCNVFTFHAHRAILYPACPFFKSAFDTNLYQDGTITMHDTDIPSFEKVVPNL